MYKKLAISFILLIFLAIAIPNVSADKVEIYNFIQYTTAENQSLSIVYPQQEYYKAGENITLNFHVYNSSKILVTNESANCTLHIYGDTGEHIVSTNLSYDADDADFYYVIDKSQTERIGRYPYLINCVNTIDEGGFLSTYFSTTQSGSTSTIQESIIYSILIVFVTILFCLTSIGSYKVDGNNEFSMGGDLVEINYGKYVKIALGLVSYLLLTFITFLCWQTSYNFLAFNFMSNIFEMSFLILQYLTIPLIMIVTIVAITKWLLDVKLHKLKVRGLKPR